jgi:rhodanese-related sulfurtransferase
MHVKDILSPHDNNSIIYYCKKGVKSKAPVKAGKE